MLQLVGNSVKKVGNASKMHPNCMYKYHFSFLYIYILVLSHIKIYKRHISIIFPIKILWLSTNSLIRLITTSYNISLTNVCMVRLDGPHTFTRVFEYTARIVSATLNIPAPAISEPAHFSNYEVVIGEINNKIHKLKYIINKD